jgi:TRAP transporter TAXI family solute receptor
MIIVSKSLSDDQVYEMTKAIFENLDVMSNTHARGADISLETALEGMSIDVHPGAQRYFDEATQ